MNACFKFLLFTDKELKKKSLIITPHFGMRRCTELRPRDNAKLFHLFGGRSHQTLRDESRVRVVVQLSVAPAVIRVLSRDGREGGREIVPGEDRARGGNGIRRRARKPIESQVSLPLRTLYIRYPWQLNHG